MQNPLAKFIGILVLAFVTFSGANAQTDIQKQLAEGDWQVFGYTGHFSKAMLDSMRYNKHSHRRKINGNGTYHSFNDNGGFAVKSKKDYGASNRKGSFTVNTAEKTITKNLVYDNGGWGGEAPRKETLNEKIVYLQNGNLVLQSNKHTVYLYRVASQTASRW